MPDQPRSYSGTEFMDKLQKDEITAPIVFTGMVKKSEEDKASFLFAAGGTCDHWVKIPVSSVEKVEVLEIAPCKTHSHPLVNLYLKSPQSPEAQLFSALAQGVRTTGERSQGFMMPQPPSWPSPYPGPWPDPHPGYGLGSVIGPYPRWGALQGLGTIEQAPQWPHGFPCRSGGSWCPPGYCCCPSPGGRFPSECVPDHGLPCRYACVNWLPR